MWWHARGCGTHAWFVRRCPVRLAARVRRPRGNATQVDVNGDGALDLSELTSYIVEAGLSQHAGEVRCRRARAGGRGWAGWAVDDAAAARAAQHAAEPAEFRYVYGDLGSSVLAADDAGGIRRACARHCRAAPMGVCRGRRSGSVGGLRTGAGAALYCGAPIGAIGVVDGAGEKVRMFDIAAHEDGARLVKGACLRHDTACVAAPAAPQPLASRACVSRRYHSHRVLACGVYIPSHTRACT